MRQNDAQQNVSAKLMNTWQGPYVVTEIMSNDVYRLNLAEGTLMHNAFHTSKLRPYVLTERGMFPIRDQEPIRPGPVEPQEPNVYEVERILTHDFKGRHHNKLRFKVIWRGYPDSEATMQRGDELYEDSPESIKTYLKAIPQTEARAIRHALGITA